jgi:hypothetical protein
LRKPHGRSRDRRSLHFGPSDFLLRIVTVMNCMRLSEKKHPTYARAHDWGAFAVLDLLNDATLSLLLPRHCVTANCHLPIEHHKFNHNPRFPLTFLLVSHLYARSEPVAVWLHSMSWRIAA